MHIDLRSLADNLVVQGDICIIGAGVAGITLAREFANTNYKVLLLEGGGFEYDQRVQKLYDGEIHGQQYFPLMSSRLHYFGGTSNHWGGLCSTLDEIDFTYREWVPDSGWPISKTNLTPYYKKALPILDLGPYEFEAQYWISNRHSFSPIPIDTNYFSNKIFQWSRPTRFSEKFKDELVHSSNIFLYTYANATNIKTDEKGNLITEVVAKNYTGKTTIFRASYFILAANALQNARLLLASTDKNKDGLGNSNKLVGKYFMEHPEIKIGELWFKSRFPLDMYKWTEKIRAELAITPYQQKKLQTLNATIGLRFLSEDKNRISNVQAWSRKDPRQSMYLYQTQELNKPVEGFFSRHFSIKQKFAAYGIHIRMEQAPNIDSKVYLIKDELDSLGMPKLALKWSFTSIDKRTLLKVTKLLALQIGKANVGRVKLEDFLLDENDLRMPPTVSSGWHHMGTTKMHANPKKGVVDKNCRLHELNNLFVAGASCFPTVGCAPPTLSIVALTIRLSDHLKKLLKQQ